MTQKNVKKKNSSKKIKRSVYIGAKVTPDQKEKILRIAKECDLTVSDYLLARAVNYRPKARLSPQGYAIASELIEIRGDLNRFFTTLNGLSQGRRIEMMRTYPFILGWLKELQKIALSLEPVIRMLTDKNTLPSDLNEKEDNFKEDSL